MGRRQRHGCHQHVARLAVWHVRRSVSGSDDERDRKSTRLNSSHLVISYAVFCLKKKKNKIYYNRCISNLTANDVSSSDVCRRLHSLLWLAVIHRIGHVLPIAAT